MSTALSKAILLFVFLTCSLWAEEQLFLLPEEQKEALKVTLNLIQGAEKNLDIAIYSFTHQELSKAIQKAAARGVQVRLIYDSSTIKDNASTIGYLAKYRNIQACTLTGNVAKNGEYKGLMHTKMALVDGKSLLLGSANWSRNAFENNYETLVIVHRAEWIQKASLSFERMIKRCKRY